jgi:hypothetical protein
MLKKQSNAFVHIMLEASKNVYDHGNGKAVVTLTEIDSIITFEFIDGNTELVNLAHVSNSKNCRKKPNIMQVLGCISYEHIMGNWLQILISTIQKAVLIILENF